MTTARQSSIFISDEEVIKETDKAIAVTNARGKLVWLPKSQCEFYDDGTISVPQWLADDREVEGMERR